MAETANKGEGKHQHSSSISTKKTVFPVVFPRHCENLQNPKHTSTERGTMTVVGWQVGWWLVYDQILVGCTHFLPFHGMSTKPMTSSQGQDQGQGEGRRALPLLPFAKMFLLEFYFISLDFDGFIVCPGLRCNGVTAASLL